MSKKNYKYGDPYKFKSLKVYSSSEWMANSTKKYRRVFEKEEVTYLRAQFSFYNKLFDEEDWQSNITLKAFDAGVSPRKEICSLGSDHTISKSKNIVHIYESWGVDKPGGFWDSGKYVCEAYIDEKYVGSQVFYIQNIGIVSNENNPYFDIVSLKLFEGPHDGWKEKERTYLTQFNKESTRYVWMELKINNKTNKDWTFEYFINFYDNAGQPKAQMANLKFIQKGSKGNITTFERGWGNKEPGSWQNNQYSIEIVFMDTLIVSAAFSTGETETEGLVNISKSGRMSAIQHEIEEDVDDNASLEEVIAKLDNLIGLETIKQKIKDHVNYLDFLRLRKSKGFEETEGIQLHSVFTGNPGTGKTTVVKLLGKIYQKKGLLSKGHVYEVDRTDLVGEFIGQTAPKVKEAIEEARGGILFIDEAYMLVRSADDKKDFGKEVIEVIVKEISDGEGDIAIMMAGYPKETMFMINSNPGLKSRIKYFFNFDDYTPKELLQIALYASQKRAVILTDEGRELIKKILTESYRNRDNTFGNARYAYSLIDEGKMNMGLRVMQKENVNELSMDELSTITKEDVENIEIIKGQKKIDIPVDEQMLSEVLHELNSLIGLDKIKSEINELIKLIKYYRETGKDVLNRFSLHAVFTGNPGTGKTTIARIFGNLYKSLGLLERGHFVETGKEGLVAGYIGQTSIKTKEKIDEAMGGVLFIDEAYSLSGGQNSYGNEAIEIILKNMEDCRGKFAVIVAGYPENMETFLRMNPGLKSRFDKTLYFKDYNPEILYDITKSMIAMEELNPDKEAEEHLKKYITELYKKRDKYFGNARTMRKLAEESIRKQNLRMASMKKSERTKKIITTLTLKDIKDINVEEEINKTIKLGF